MKKQDAPKIDYKTFSFISIFNKTQRFHTVNKSKHFRKGMPNLKTDYSPLPKKEV